MQQSVNINDIRGELIEEGVYGGIYNVRGKSHLVMKIPKLERYNQNKESIMMMEISALKSLKGYNNIVQMEYILYDMNNIPIIIMHKYTHDLSHVYHIHGHHLKSFMFDICNGLLAIHNMGLYHLDIKPSNLMFQNGRIYIGDFGLTKKAFPNSNEIMNCVAQATFCRAPEILIANICDKPCIYSYEADIWSVGIVMYYLKTGIYPFIADSELDIINLIFNFFNVGEYVDCDTSKVLDDYRFDIHAVERHFRANNLYASSVKDELDFLSGLLHPNPKLRFTMTNIFEHPYLRDSGEHQPILTYKEKVIKSDISILKPLAIVYKDQVELNLKSRSILVKWLISVCEGYQIHESVIFLAIMLLDIYMDMNKKIRTKNFQLVGISCFIIANRLLYYKVLPLDTYRDLSYTGLEIEQSILQILREIDYTLYMSTEFNYLAAYLQDNIYSEVPDADFNMLYEQCIAQLKENISHDTCRNIHIDVHVKLVLSMYSMTTAKVNIIDLS